MRTAPTRLLTILAVASISAMGCGDDAKSTDTGNDATTPDSVEVTPDGTNNPETDTTPEVVPETETETETAGCGLRECGTFGALNCGTCDSKPGTECNDSGRCVVPGVALGGFCGITTTCTEGSADYPLCLDSQCETGLCMSKTAAGGFVFALIRDWGEFVSPNSFCTSSCIIYDDKNGDGVNDADQQDDCNPPDVVNGPVGNALRCVNFAGPGEDPVGLCIPGTDFATCTSNEDCQDGDGCELTSIQGALTGRCIANYRAGAWGQVAGMGESCNRDPAEGPIELCEQGFCYGGTTGCSTACATNADCVTADAACTGGMCAGKPGKTCTTNADCGSMVCGDALETGYTHCLSKECQDDLDCGGGFSCDFSWNRSILEPGVIQECTRDDEDGVGFREACDPDPDDATLVNGGAVCKSNLCIGEECSALCSSHDQCGDGGYCYSYEDSLNFIPCEIDGDCGAGNGCTAGEDGDGACYDLSTQLYIQGDDVIGVLQYNFCIFYDDAAGSCLTDGDCAADHRCDTLQTRKFVDGVLDPDAPVITEGLCVPDAGTKEYGEECASGSDCKDGFCFPITDSTGFCTKSCTGSDDCGSFDLGEEPVNGFCRANLWTYGGDINNPNFFNYLNLCHYEFGSMTDCSEDFTCAEATEACYSNIVAGLDPTKPSTTEYFCSQFWETAEERPATSLGDTCDPELFGSDCPSGICLTNDAGTASYCSALCKLEGTECGEALTCEEQLALPRQGAYVANSGSYNLCVQP